VIADEKMLSVPETAVLCGVTRSTINNRINNKKLYAIRSGRNYAVPAKELLIFLYNEPPGTFLFLAKMEGGVKILLDIDRVLSGEEIAALEKTT